jgi:hypothetical protein
MRDGRKWKAVPFIIFANGIEGSCDYSGLPPSVTILPLMCNRHPAAALAEINNLVSVYHESVLKEYERLGIMVRLDHGHVQIGPALRKNASTLEGSYYRAEADRRSHRGWVTVKRDREGLRHDVEMFQALLEQRATETEMHRFLEQHPALLMEAMLGIPLSHKPVFTRPRRMTPDYLLSPILGPVNGAAVGLLELKGPGEPILAGPRLHRGLAAKIHHAIDQVRDYSRYLQDPANHPEIVRSIGHAPNRSKLAVLIGRTPRNCIDRENFALRKSQIDVEIVTYDDVLEIQADQ